MASTSRPSLYALALCLLPLLNLASGLQVTPGSECAAYCLDGPDDDLKNPSSSSTNSTDIVCLNEEYWSTARGTKYRTCMECLQNSTSVNGTESDVSWYLYNLRYAVDVCLFSFPHADAENTSTSSPCVLAENCLPLRTALETGHLTPGNGSDYDYCSADNSAFGGSALDSCIQCFRTASHQTYMSNFLTALSAGCEEKPAAGTLMSLSGTLFSSTAVNYTGASSSTSGGTSSSSPDSSLATGAIVGIAVGAALLIASAVLLFYLYWRRQKRQSLYYFPRDGPRSLGPTRQVKSISSSTITGGGGYIPHYTVDYKRPPGADHQRQQFEMYGQYNQYNQNNQNDQSQIKTQHVVIPQRSKDLPETATAGLWGRDTPMQKQHFISSAQAKTPLANQVAFDDAAAAAGNMGLDEMPTHPAFIPRAFTRGSRNPSAAVREWQHSKQQPLPPPKSYKPDDFVVQQYLDTVDDTSTIDVRSLISPPLPTANTANTVKSTTSLLSNNPYASLQTQTQTQTQTAQNTSVPPPPSNPPPAYSGPVIAPNLSLPSFSRVRSPKRYAPPPINIELARPKAQRMPDGAAESGMP